MSVAIDPRQRTAIAVGGLALAMLGLGFASVPLYRIFCEVTGLNGTTQRAVAGAALPAVGGGQVSVRFDANRATGLPWQFAPEKRHQTVILGARTLAFYTAANDAATPVTGRATFNVTPSAAGKYFTKIDCFCFTEQTLQPGERVRMPVQYYVDPAIATDPDTRDIQEITLSYTFYPVDAARTAG